MHLAAEPVVEQIRAWVGQLGRLAGVDREDLVQEALLRYCDLARKVHGEGRTLPCAAANGIARNVWLEALRARARLPRVGLEVELLDAACAPEENPADSAERKDLERAIDDLLRPVLGRTGLRLFHTVLLDGVSWREAAGLHGLPEAVGDATRKKIRRFLRQGRGLQSLKALLPVQPSTLNPQPVNSLTYSIVAMLLFVSAVPGPTDGLRGPLREPAVSAGGVACSASAGEPFVAYARIAFRTGTGCTPYLVRWPDGSISWGGCPTITCATDDCAADTTGQDLVLSCRCQDDGAGVLCKGRVFFLPDGKVVSWGCEMGSCADAGNGDDCWWQSAPAEPQTGQEKFSVCWCGQ